MILRKAFISAIALAGVSLSACGDAQASEDGVILVAPGDEEMVAARDEARETLPQFWDRWTARADEDSNFGLKFDLNHGHPERGDAELIWTSNVVRIGDTITARLANEPLTEGYSVGQRVEFTEDAIVDWQIERGGKLQGHYTTRVLLKRMPPEEAAAIEEMLW